MSYQYEISQAEAECELNLLLPLLIPCPVCWNMIFEFNIAHLPRQSMRPARWNSSSNTWDIFYSLPWLEDVGRSFPFLPGNINSYSLSDTQEKSPVACVWWTMTLILGIYALRCDDWWRIHKQQKFLVNSHILSEWSTSSSFLSYECLILYLLLLHSVTPVVILIADMQKVHSGWQ